MTPGNTGRTALFVVAATALLPGSAWGRSDGAMRVAAPARTGRNDLLAGMSDR